jgi:hypothetical protein
MPRIRIFIDGIEKRGSLMNWLMRLLGAPNNLSDRRQWASEHPIRSSAVAASLLSGFLSVFMLVRTQRLLLSCGTFVAIALFLFAVSYINLLVRVRRSG